MNTAGCLASIPAISLTPSARLVLVGNPRGQRELEKGSTNTEVLPWQWEGIPVVFSPSPAAMGCEVCSDCSMHQSMCGGVKVRQEVALQKGERCAHSISPVERSDAAEMGSLCKGRTCLVRGRGGRWNRGGFSSVVFLHCSALSGHMRHLVWYFRSLRSALL